MTRSIYLVRHAMAEERGPAWPDDSQRPLTEQGAARMRHIVRGWNRLGIGVDLVITSPFVRAAQTAKILVDGLEERPELETLPALAPGHAPARVARALSSRYKRSSVALVGHEPDLGMFAAWLLRAANPLPFKKGGAARIDIDAWPPRQDGTLVWLATPKLLRLAGD